MAKSDFGFDPTAYAPVAERIRLFWESFPGGRITTRLVSRTEHDIVFEARVYRAATDIEPAATGWAAEREGDGDINAVACLENTETSAVGRALANLGFTAAKERPSAEEMQKAARVRTRLASHRVAERPPVRADRATSADALTVRYVDGNPRQSYANIVSDLLRLLERAERHGLRPHRAHRWRETLLARQFSAELLTACERRLRAWLARRMTDA
jgi:hypothetical protein